MQTPSILVVDDDATILDMISDGLRHQKHPILTAKSGEEGLAILAKEPTALVISDQKMDGMSGIEFLKRVKAVYPETLTIILTGYADLRTAQEAINRAGVYKFMTKPINIIELQITVKRAMELQALVMERDQLLNRVKAYEARMSHLEKQSPGITKVKRDANGNVVLDLD